MRLDPAGLTVWPRGSWKIFFKLSLAESCGIPQTRIIKQYRKALQLARFLVLVGSGLVLGLGLGSGSGLGLGVGLGVRPYLDPTRKCFVARKLE